MRPQSWLWLRINHFLQLQSESVQREQCRHSAATQKQSNNRNPIDPFNVCPYLGPIWRKRCERCHKNVFEIKKNGTIQPRSTFARFENGMARGRSTQTQELHTNNIKCVSHKSIRAQKPPTTRKHIAHSDTYDCNPLQMCGCETVKESHYRN